jgi:hypothetical protein
MLLSFSTATFHCVSRPSQTSQLMARLLVSLVVLFNFVTSAIAAPGSACSSGIYKQLLTLSAYAPAESYCFAHFPLPTSTVTTAVSAGNSKHSNAANISERAVCNTDSCLRVLSNKGATATSDCRKATGTAVVCFRMLRFGEICEHLLQSHS